MESTDVPLVMLNTQYFNSDMDSGHETEKITINGFSSKNKFVINCFTGTSIQYYPALIQTGLKMKIDRTRRQANRKYEK